MLSYNYSYNRSNRLQDFTLAKVLYKCVVCAHMYSLQIKREHGSTKSITCVKNDAINCVIA